MVCVLFQCLRCVSSVKICEITGRAHRKCLTSLFVDGGGWKGHFWGQNQCHITVDPFVVFAQSLYFFCANCSFRPIFSQDPSPSSRVPGMAFSEGRTICAVDQHFFSGRARWMMGWDNTRSVWVYVCLCMYVYISLFVCASACVRLRMYVCVCVCVCSYVRVRVCARVCCIVTP